MFNVYPFLFIVSLVSLFSTTQKVNDPCGQHIYIYIFSWFDENKSFN